MSKPPRTIPNELLPLYTINNRIPVYDGYSDNSVNENIIWSKEMMDDYILRFTFDNILNNKQGSEPYTNASLWHVQLLKNINITGLNVAVIGSQTPWIEAILLNANVGHITTIDYNKPICSHEKITVISYDDFVKCNTKFDIIFSYSSIEHSGLGRYGDSLNPNGDIEAMDEIYKKLKNNGILLLGIPIGRDALTWNNHRVYGPLRIRLLFDKFIELDWVGIDKNFMYYAPEYTFYQPIIILRPKSILLPFSNDMSL